MENQKTATIIKASILGILGAASSFLVFYFFDRFLISFNFNTLWLVLSFGITFLVLFTLQSFFIRDITLLSAFSFLQGIIPIIIFTPYFQNNGFLYFVGTAVLIFILFLIIGSKRGFDNINNSVSIEFFSISHGVVIKAFVGILILILAYSYFYLFHLDNFSDQKGEALFERTLDSVEPALKIWFPGVTFNMELQDALDKMTEVEIQRSKIELLKQGIDFDELPENVQSEMLVDIKDQIRMTLENLTGTQVEPSQQLNDYLFESLNNWLSSFSYSVRLFFKVGALLLLFFIIKGLSFLIYIPVQAISFIFFKLLTLVGFADIGIRTVSKEEIII